jgi:signal transduction histidine kinase
MNIKLRLSLQFMLIVAGILLFFSALVYYFSYESQVAKFQQNLFDRARNTATLLINVQEVDSSLLEKIQRSTMSLYSEEVVLTDSAFNIIYDHNSKILSDAKVFSENEGEQIHYFSIGGKDGVFYRHNYKGHTYNVYVMAYDRSRSENLSELKKVLLWSIISSVLLSVLLAYFFAKRAMKPISRIIRSVKDINSLKLHSRLDEGKRKDEIEQLAVTFNELLSDLETAFRNQEDFVSNASHELRTPLSVMIGESDYFLSHDRTKEEYSKHVEGLVADLKNLNALINSLLELARLNREQGIVFSNTRIDEVVFTAIQIIKEKYNSRRILPRITYPENGSELIISGNSGLLEIAFRNLLDNACKFSDGDIEVSFLIDDDLITVNIIDQGIGIPVNEIENISKPFNRASNVRFIGGFGIGLALVTRIMELHHAKLNISSRLNEGSRFEMKFQRQST